MRQASAASTPAPRRARRTISQQALQRTLYNWTRPNGKLLLELAKSVTPRKTGSPTPTAARRTYAYPQDTADDIIWSFTRIMDGSKGYPAARYVRIIKGPRRRENQARDLRPEEIDDFTLEMTLTDKVDPAYYFLTRVDRILPTEEVEKGHLLASNPVGLGRSKFKEHIPGSRVVGRALGEILQPGKPYADSSKC